MIPPICPNSYPSHPHHMALDPNGGWYCPLERAAEREQAHMAELAAQEAEKRHEQARAIARDILNADDLRIAIESSQYTTILTEDLLEALTAAAEQGMEARA